MSNTVYVIPQVSQSKDVTSHRKELHDRRVFELPAVR